MSRKPWVAATVAATVVLALAGCAHGSNAADSPTPVETSASAPSSPIDTPTPTQVCASGALTAVLAGAPDHSAGQAHYSVTVTNSGTAVCPLPAAAVTVQPESAVGGKALGNPAASSITAASSLVAGASTTVQFALVNSQNFDPTACAAQAASAIKLSWGASGPVAEFALNESAPVCTGTAITNVLQVTVG